MIILLGFWKPTFLTTFLTPFFTIFRNPGAIAPVNFQKWNMVSQKVVKNQFFANFSKMAKMAIFDRFLAKLPFLGHFLSIFRHFFGQLGIDLPTTSSVNTFFADFRVVPKNDHPQGGPKTPFFDPFLAIFGPKYE